MEPEKDSDKKFTLEGAEQAKPVVGSEEIVDMSGHSGFNFAMALGWLTCLLAIVITMFFWWLDRGLKQEVVDKRSEKDGIIQQIVSPTYANIENKASDFKSAVTALSSAKKARYSSVSFLNEFYKKVTNDIKISNISVSDTSVLSISGTTSTYRNVADLMLALKSWNVLSSVELLSISSQVDEESNEITTTFSISAKIDKTKDLVEATNTTASSATSAALSTTTTSSTGASDEEGGSDETN